MNKFSINDEVYCFREEGWDINICKCEVKQVNKEADNTYMYVLEEMRDDRRRWYSDEIIIWGTIKECLEYGLENIKNKNDDKEFFLNIANLIRERVKE